MKDLKTHNIYKNAKEKYGKYLAYMDTPIGLMEFLANDEALISIMFVEEREKQENPNTIIKESIAQFDEYFKGKLKQFKIELKFNGTEFQNKVWKELTNIPYGETISYMELARRVGSPKGFRAVGNANSKNIYNIIAPCHRVIGANKELTGYAGGIDKKKWLLEFEKMNNIK